MSELLERLVAFGDALRREGVAVGTDGVATFCEAVALAPEDLYWAGRVTLVSREGDLAVYDRVFGAHFGGVEVRTAATPEQPPVEQRMELPSPEDVGSEGDADGELSLMSAVEVLRDKSFAAYTEEELRVLLEVCARIDVPTRRTRRYRASRGGSPDMRRTLHRSLRMGGEPVERAWRTRRLRRRRVVLLLDVSGSMTSYSRALLHFALASVRAQQDWEVFCFATRLSRLTRTFRTGTPDDALAHAVREVVDWDGGTRIGASIATFLREYGRAGMARGAVVIICSDGLEVDDPDNVRVQMERLALLAHRVVWLNPLKGDPRYEPLARGMAAALPSIDVFASGHNLASLEALAEGLPRLVGARA